LICSFSANPVPGRLSAIRVAKIISFSFHFVGTFVIAVNDRNLMKNETYPYYNTQASWYTFTSTGKRSIAKQVVFTYTGIRNIVNMGFGDLLPDGSIDDRANSNNGDIVKVLATIVRILIDSTEKFPHTEIFFAGSTQERTRLYTRILGTYYTDFNKEFNINGLLKKGHEYIEVESTLGSGLKFMGFIVKRNH
jgi:hypothetical protein